MRLEHLHGAQGQVDLAMWPLSFFFLSRVQDSELHHGFGRLSAPSSSPLVVHCFRSAMVLSGLILVSLLFELELALPGASASLLIQLRSAGARLTTEDVPSAASASSLLLGLMFPAA